MSLAAAERAQVIPNELALADERTTLSWAELDPILNRAANRLLASGGISRIAIYATNCVETVLAHVGGLHAGVSTVPVSFHLTADELAYILEDSGAQALFVGPETLAAARQAAAQVGLERLIAWRSSPTEGVTSWEDWLAGAGDVEPPADTPLRPHLHYTSGTTGRPKGVETPPTIFARSQSVGEFFERLQVQARAAGPRSPCLIVGPLYHTGPLITSVRFLGGGMALVVMSRFDPEKALETIERFRIKSAIMVPTHFQRLLALPRDVRERYDVSSLANVTHTGSACPVEVKRRMIEWFGPILTEVYGGTEAGTTNMITSPEWLAKPGSVGKTVPPFELLVVSDEGERLGANQVGQLYFRDTTGRGIIYYNDAAKTRAAHLQPGVFTLGEVGYCDDDEYVFITDRVSDMIVSGGVNIYPAESERVLIQHDQVADVVIVGAPNTDMGEEVKAIIVPLDPAAPPTPDELDRFCRERLAGYKCPRSYDFAADIGRNAMGKINKRELRRRFWPTERTVGG